MYMCFISAILTSIMSLVVLWFIIKNYNLRKLNSKIIKRNENLIKQYEEVQKMRKDREEFIKNQK